MNVQVTFTGTDAEANTRIKSDIAEASEDYLSGDASTAAESIGLTNAAEWTAAKLLPSDFSFHTMQPLNLQRSAVRVLSVGKHRRHDNGSSDIAISVAPVVRSRCKSLRIEPSWAMRLHGSELSELSLLRALLRRSVSLPSGVPFQRRQEKRS